MAIRSKMQGRKQQHAVKPAIDLDTYQASCAENNVTKWWIEDLHLLDLDKSLLTSGAWINAAIINACQVVLSKQFSLDLNFQDVGCGLTMCFSIVSGSFIQILHDSDRHHWLTISNIGSDQTEVVQVYDSMFSYSTSSLRAQVACLLHTCKPSFVLNFVDVHKQVGHNDCGVFSVAYAVSLCFDQQPGELMFDQSLMRHHLVTCLQLQQFTMFPAKSKRRRNLKIRNSENVNVFCICRMPDIPHQPDMICCSKCSTWFHADVCVGAIPEDAWKKHTQWHCPSCKQLAT